MFTVAGRLLRVAVQVQEAAVVGVIKTGREGKSETGKIHPYRL